MATRKPKNKTTKKEKRDDRVIEFPTHPGRSLADVREELCAEIQLFLKEAASHTLEVRSVGTDADGVVQLEARARATTPGAEWSAWREHVVTVPRTASTMSCRAAAAYVLARVRESYAESDAKFNMPWPVAREDCDARRSCDEVMSEILGSLMKVHSPYDVNYKLAYLFSSGRYVTIEAVCQDRGIRPLNTTVFIPSTIDTVGGVAEFIDVTLREMMEAKDGPCFPLKNPTESRVAMVTWSLNHFIQHYAQRCSSEAIQVRNVRIDEYTVHLESREPGDMHWCVREVRVITGGPVSCRHAAMYVVDQLRRENRQKRDNAEAKEPDHAHRVHTPHEFVEPPPSSAGPFKLQLNLSGNGSITVTTDLPVDVTTGKQ